MGIGWVILWTICGVVTLAAAVLAGWSSRWRYVGRGAVGVLFVIGGALAHVVNLVSGAGTAATTAQADRHQAAAVLSHARANRT